MVRAGATTAGRDTYVMKTSVKGLCVTTGHVKMANASVMTDGRDGYAMSRKIRVKELCVSTEHVLMVLANVKTVGKEICVMRTCAKESLVSKEHVKLVPASVKTVGRGPYVMRK